MTGSLFLDARETPKFLFPKGCILKIPGVATRSHLGRHLNLDPDTPAPYLREEASSPLLHRTSFLGLRGAHGMGGANPP